MWLEDLADVRWNGTHASEGKVLLAFYFGMVLAVGETLRRTGQHRRSAVGTDSLHAWRLPFDLPRQGRA